MKGSLHSDELLGAVVARDSGLRTGRRISHVFIMDVPTYHKVLIVTDAAINIAPTLEDKVDICQNAIDLAISLGVQDAQGRDSRRGRDGHLEDAGDDRCRGAVQDGRPRADHAAALLDGPLAFDNAISKEAARIKGIVSEVAGDPDILLVPDLEAGQHARQAAHLPGQRRQRRARRSAPACRSSSPAAPTACARASPAARSPCWPPTRAASRCEAA